MSGKLLKTIVAAIFAVGISGGSACATLLSFSISGIGNVTTDTSNNITAATTSIAIPSMELVSSIATPSTAVLAGISAGNAVSFSNLTLNTVVGPFSFTLTAGDLTFSFTNISSALIVPSGVSTNGSISEQFNGTVTGDTSLGATFLNQTASLSQTCTQAGLRASISCSQSLMTPGLPIRTPEPATLALFGLGLTGLGLIKRKRAA